MNKVCRAAALMAGLCFGLACGGGGSVVLHKVASVQVSPRSFTMGLGSNLQLAATVTGSSDQAVTWQVNQTPGGNATVGTVDATGLYIAPTTMPTSAINVSAVSQVDGTTSGSASITLTGTDPVGTAQGKSISCKQGKINTNNSCFSVDLSCPGVADFTAYVKVTVPSGTPVGTVMFTGGGNGTGLYEDYTFGDTAVSNVVAAQFVAVQTSFGGPFTDLTPDGWQTGPGGIRRLACRYATLAQWVYNSTSIHAAGKPLCATGNSSGGQLIAETLAHYGTDSIFSMVEPTSGPPFSDMEKSCICGSDANVPVPGACGVSVNQCLEQKDAKAYVDPAYASPICSSSLSTHATTNQAQFISDTIQSPGATLDYPNTYVHFLFGGKDTSSAVTLGPDYLSAITSSRKSMACVNDAPHSMADVLDGAQQVASDIISGCHLY